MAQTTPTRPPPAVVEGPQPTVRVMRLYKPLMHVVPTVPQLSSDSLFAPSGHGPKQDFSISQYLLLPDSFGDIYFGELFAAYVSVVNGVQDTAFSQVSLAVRLQTAKATHDLFDSRAANNEISGHCSLLEANNSLDMVVQHSLSELGPHTLRVSVSYMDKQNEVKTFKKFYRFNVLNPLQISYTCFDLNDQYLIQAQIVNSTKSMIFIEKIELLTSHKLDVSVIQPSSSVSTLPESGPLQLDAAAYPLLQPDEAYAVALRARKTPGFSAKNIGIIDVRWCTSMGERGHFRSDDIITNKHLSTPKVVAGSPEKHINMISVCLLRAPKEAYIGEVFHIVIRITNYISHSITAQLQNKPSKPNQQGLVITGLSYLNLGLLESGEGVEVELCVVPVSGGLQEINGLVAVDVGSRVEFPVDAICKVMVYDTNLHLDTREE